MRFAERRVGCRAADGFVAAEGDFGATEERSGIASRGVDGDGLVVLLVARMGNVVWVGS